MKEFMKKASLLLLSIPTAMMVTALTASMTQIYATYPQYQDTIVTMIVTIPDLSVLVGLILAPILVKKIAGKTLILAGLSIFTACNILAVWVDNFYLLLMLRALSGVGAGLIPSLQATYFATYPENQRVTLMGLVATVGCLIGAGIASISGLIAEYSWKYVLYLYLINVLAIVLTIVFIPKNPEVAEATVTEEVLIEDDKKHKLLDFAPILFIYYFLIGGSSLFMAVLTAEMAPYLEYTALGGAAVSGVMVSVYMVGSMVSGVSLGPFVRIFKQYSMVVTFLCFGIGAILLWLASSLITVGIAVFLVGFFLGIINCVSNYELSVKLPLDVFTSAAAGINIFVYVLQFAAPFLFLTLLGIIPGGSFRIMFLIYAIVQLIFMVLAYVLPKVLIK